MESVSLVNLDELLPVLARKKLTDIAVKKYVIPQVSNDIYRVFYRNGDFEDFQAENAFEVKSICCRTDITKIIAFKVCYPDILLANQHHIHNVSEISVSSTKQTEVVFHEYDLARFNEPFELLDLQQYSVMQNMFKQ